MSNPVDDSRAELVAVLSTIPGIGRVFDYVPETFVPPCAFIVPSLSGAYVEQGTTFGSVVVRFQVRVLVKAGTNESEDKALGAIIDAALPLLIADGWQDISFGAPVTYEWGSGNAVRGFPGVPITLSNQYKL